MLRAIYSLIRLPNLAMIVLTQYLVLYCVIKPLLPKDAELISTMNFLLLVLSSVLIAAAGYIINDYFDMRADRVNKPDTMTIGRKISRRGAILLHWVLNIIGILLGIYLAWRLNAWKLGSINIIVAILLWFYSTNFKRQLLTGNLVIAALSAFIPAVVWLFEFFPLSTDAETIKIMLRIFTGIILPYSVFAFLVSFVRELIKDIEDIEGDEKIFCRTFPIVYGIERTKILIIAVLGLTILILGYVLFRVYFYSLYFVFIYLLITIEIPMMYMLYKVYNSEEKEQFSWLSQMTKIIMLAGILSMQVFYL